MNQSGPVPTKLMLLSDLPEISQGCKVRFLGCITKYSTKTATLTLEHNFPPGNSTKALVDIKLLVTTIKSHETHIGEWVNVMGYIQKISTPTSIATSRDVNVQAITLWSTGPFNPQGYEQSLAQKRS